MKKSLLLLAFFALLFSACKKSDSNTKPAIDPAVQAKIDDDKIQAYIKANNLSVTKDASGLYYQVLSAGSGVAPTISSTVRVAYTGKLLDGTQFDTRDNFSSSLTGLIKGWQIGIPFIKPGGRIFLIIPSALGYATAPKSGIPPNSVLVFTIDLFQVQG